MWNTTGVETGSVGIGDVADSEDHNLAYDLRVTVADPGRPGPR